MPTCRVCKKDFAYDDERGYDRELCSPMCDGIEAGRLSANEQSKRDLAEAVRLLSRAVLYVPDGLDGFIREIGDFVIRVR